MRHDKYTQSIYHTVNGLVEIKKKILGGGLAYIIQNVCHHGWPTKKIL